MSVTNRIPESLQATALYQKRESLLKSGIEICDLTESNPSKAGFAWPSTVWQSVDFDALSIYVPDSIGPENVRKSISEYYAHKNFVVSPDDVVLTASTSEAYSICFKAMTNPGDEVLVLSPGYPLIDELARLDGLNVIACQMKWDNVHHCWKIPWNDLRNSISTKTRVIAIVQPNNPLGCYLNSEERAMMIEIASDHELVLIVDEVFLDYPEDAKEKIPSLAASKLGNVFVLSGLSKPCLAPQVKLGWIVIAGEHLTREKRKNQIAYVNDAYLSVSAFALNMAPTLLKNREVLVERLLNRLSNNENHLKTSFNKTKSFSVLPRKAGWYILVKVSQCDGVAETGVRNKSSFVEKALELGVWVHPGYLFDLADDTFAISLLTDEFVFKNGIKKLLQVEEACSVFKTDTEV